MRSLDPVSGSKMPGPVRDDPDRSGRWRKVRDSNPWRAVTLNDFRGHPIRPLWQPSADEDSRSPRPRAKPVPGRTGLERSAEVGEEGREQLAALIGGDVGGDLELVVQARVRADAVERDHGAGLEVPGPEHDPADPSVDRRTGAHRARLERDDQGGGVESPGADGLRRVAQGE